MPLPTPRFFSLFARLAPLAFVLSLAGQALAIVAIGATPDDFTVHDPDDQPTTLRSLRGRPALIMYEDADARTQNRALKTRIAALSKAEGVAKKVTFFGVADTKAWNFWPLKGIVKDELRRQAKRIGTKVYADWSGEGLRKLGAEAGKSNWVLLDAGGKVLWAKSGEFAPADAQALVALLEGFAAASAPAEASAPAPTSEPGASPK